MLGRILDVGNGEKSKLKALKAKAIKLNNQSG